MHESLKVLRSGWGLSSCIFQIRVHVQTWQCLYLLHILMSVTKFCIHSMCNAYVYVCMYVCMHASIYVRVSVYKWGTYDRTLDLWSWTLLLWSFPVIHYARTVHYFSQLCTYYKLLSLVLGCVIVFLWKMYYLNIYIDFVKFIIHNHKSSPHQRIWQL